jgi:hypothetical protein
MKNIWTRIGLNLWFGIGVGLAGGGIFSMLVWTGHLSDLALFASPERADDPAYDWAKQLIFTFKELSIFSFIASFICLIVGLLKVQRNKRL